MIFFIIILFYDNTFLSYFFMIILFYDPQPKIIYLSDFKAAIELSKKLDFSFENFNRFNKILEC